LLRKWLNHEFKDVSQLNNNEIILNVAIWETIMSIDAQQATKIIDFLPPRIIKLDITSNQFIKKWVVDLIT